MTNNHLIFYPGFHKEICNRFLMMCFNQHFLFGKHPREWLEIPVVIMVFVDRLRKNKLRFLIITLKLKL